MPLIKVKEKYQVTILSKIREKIPLKVGDLLEVSVNRNRIILKPQLTIERSEAIEKFFNILSQKRKVKRVRDNEVIEDALKAIKEVRKLRDAKSRS